MKKNIIAVALFIGLAVLSGCSAGDKGKDGEAETEARTEESTSIDAEVMQAETEDPENGLSGQEDGGDALTGMMFATEDNEGGQGNADDAFRQYLSEVLIPKYGVFKSPQEGVVQINDMGEKKEGEWLDPNGILNASFYDFDMDGQDEMLVVLSSDTDSFGTPVDIGRSVVSLGIYEYEDEEVRFSDSKVFFVKEEVQDGWGVETMALTGDEWVEFCYSLSVTEVEGQVYLLCENYLHAVAFGDGINQNHWTLTYKDNSLDYAFSFTQIEGGSGDFVFAGYDYTDGELAKSTICYSEFFETEADEAYRGMNFSEAITAFFEAHGISVNQNLPEYVPYDLMTSIFSDNPDVKLLFELKNECTNSEEYDAQEFLYKITDLSYGDMEVSP